MRECYESGDAAGGNQVVPTSVANVRKRIIFSIEIDSPTARAATCFECCGNAVCVACNAEALTLKEVADCVVGFVFLEGELWIRPDLARSDEGYEG